MLARSRRKRGNQEEIDRCVGTQAGTVPIPEFFAPANVQRIIADRKDPQEGQTDS